MPKQYGVVGNYSEGQSQIFGIVPTVTHNAPVTRYSANGISIVPNPFQCCGISTIRSFDGNQIYFPPDYPTSPAGFAEKAAFLAALWAVNRGTTHYVYVLNAGQKAQNQIHKALVECGSVEVCKFSNLQPYHNNDVYMFVCNLNEGIGKFFNREGVPFKEPVKVETPEASVPAKAPSRRRRTKTVVVHDVPLSIKTPEVV